MSAYSDFVKVQMAKMKTQSMLAKDKMRVIGEMWRKQKGQAGEKAMLKKEAPKVKKMKDTKGGFIPTHHSPAIEEYLKAHTAAGGSLEEGKKHVYNVMKILKKI